MPGFGEVGQEGGVVTPKWHAGWKAAQDFTAKCQRTIDSHDPNGVAYAIPTRVTLGFRLISREQRDASDFHKLFSAFAGTT